MSMKKRREKPDKKLQACHLGRMVWNVRENLTLTGMGRPIGSRHI